MIKIAIPVIIIAALAVLLVYFLNEGNTFAELDIEYFPISDPCDLRCKEIHENQNYTCIELEANSYECREKIKSIPGEHIYTHVVPPERGEYYLIPPNSEQRLGSITGVSFYVDDSIQVTFDDKFNKDSIIIGKNQPFTSYCFESKNVHVWTFTDTVEVAGEQYIEMHKRLAKIPAGFDCNNPIHVLEKS